MQINDKILSIPPYISTSWKNIISLQVETRSSHLILIIELVSGSRVEIPHLDKPTIERIFTMHAQHVENSSGPKKNPPMQPFGFSLPFPLPGIDGLTSVLQHNTEQANAPDLPPELIEKISELTNTISPEDLAIIPKPEPHCNCPHCQIMRAMTGEEKLPALEEEVTDEDLKFRTWDIVQQADKLYIVTNPLDLKEHYSVFLGEPLGCTCGQKNCEHLQAVLHS
jgi:hypothetical protein